MWWRCVRPAPFGVGRPTAGSWPKGLERCRAFGAEGLGVERCRTRGLRVYLFLSFRGARFKSLLLQEVQAKQA